MIARNHAALRDLLERGKPVNSIDNMGWMPLHWAAQLGDLESAKMILNQGMKILHILPKLLGLSSLSCDSQVGVVLVNFAHFDILFLSSMY